MSAYSVFVYEFIACSAPWSITEVVWSVSVFVCLAQLQSGLGKTQSYLEPCVCVSLCVWSSEAHMVEEKCTAGGMRYECIRSGLFKIAAISIWTVPPCAFLSVFVRESLLPHCVTERSSYRRGVAYWLTGCSLGLNDAEVKRYTAGQKHTGHCKTTGLHYSNRRNRTHPCKHTLSRVQRGVCTSRLTHT